jgi:hypothetical protein
MPEEGERCRLIGEIARVLKDHAIPEDARHAGLTLIAYLARRMPGECASQDGVEVMVRRSAQLLASHGCRNGKELRVAELLSSRNPGRAQSSGGNVRIRRRAR